MTARGPRLARLALVAVALNIAVLGAISARVDHGRATSSVSFVKTAAVAVPQAIVERQSQPNHPLSDLVWVAALIVAAAALEWALAQQRRRALPAVATPLTWHRRGPPLALGS